MTSVGGTTLSTDAEGGWLAEQAWFDVPLSQGTGGGVSTLFERAAVAARCRRQGSARTEHRQTDDPGHLRRRGSVHRGEDRPQRQDVVGGGTSQSAPIWAGLAAVMNQYLLANGGGLIGDINPLLYRIARAHRCPHSAT